MKVVLFILVSMMFFFIVVAANNNSQFKEFLVLGQSNIINSNTVAERAHKTETLEIPPGTNSFIMLIANEAHESWNNERHKLITDKNSYNIPSNLVIYEGTKLVFLNADAPWDTPHPQKINIVDFEKENANNSNSTVYSTGTLQYPDYSTSVLLRPGKYLIENDTYDTKEGSITVLENNPNNQVNTVRNLTIMGGFYTPTNKVENNKDNDGNYIQAH